jgi:hypothetical protein
VDVSRLGITLSADLPYDKFIIASSPELLHRIDREGEGEKPPRRCGNTEAGRGTCLRSHDSTAQVEVNASRVLKPSHAGCAGLPPWATSSTAARTTSSYRLTSRPRFLDSPSRARGHDHKFDPIDQGLLLLWVFANSLQPAELPTLQE